MPIFAKDLSAGLDGLALIPKTDREWAGGSGADLPDLLYRLSSEVRVTITGCYHM